MKPPRGTLPGHFNSQYACWRVIRLAASAKVMKKEGGRKGGKEGAKCKRTRSFDKGSGEWEWERLIERGPYKKEPDIVLDVQPSSEPLLRLA